MKTVGQSVARGLLLFYFLSLHTKQRVVFNGDANIMSGNSIRLKTIRQIFRESATKARIKIIDGMLLISKECSKGGNESKNHEGSIN